MRKGILLLSALILLALPVYAVLINLSSDNIARIGGTGQVDVQGPESVSKVKWGLTQTAPYRVNKVYVEWTPHPSSTYTVYVTIYSSSSPIASGSATASGSGQITTEITLDQSVDPKDISKVEIIIVETPQ